MVAQLTWLGPEVLLGREWSKRKYVHRPLVCLGRFVRFFYEVALMLLEIQTRGGVRCGRFWALERIVTVTLAVTMTVSLRFVGIPKCVVC